MVRDRGLSLFLVCVAFIGIDAFPRSVASPSSKSSQLRGPITWVVNAVSGNDSNPGTVDQPFRTITKALSVSLAGDTVSVRPGTYNRLLGETFALRPPSGVKLMSTNGPLVTIIDASGANPRQRVFELLGNSASSTIDGFTIMGGQDAPSGVNNFNNATGGGIFCNSNDATVISRNIIRNNSAIGFPGSLVFRPGGPAYGGGLYAAAGNTIIDNVFRDNVALGGVGYSPSAGDGGDGGNGGNGTGGALTYAGSNVNNNTFYNNIAQGGAGGSAQATGGSNGVAGAGQAGAMYSVTSATNSIFAFNQALGGPGTCCGAQSAAGTLDHNLFFNSTPPVDPVTGTNALVGVDPRLVSSTDMHIRPSSPAKGAGSAATAPVTDLENTPRPNPPSIGAYEALKSKARTDFTGDGRTDLLWHNVSTGQNYVYRMNGLTIVSQDFVNVVSDTGWQIVGTGDFNGDGNADVLWRHNVTGENYIYLMNGSSIGTNGPIQTVADLNWHVVGVGDFDGDGMADILWRNVSTGLIYIYFMNGMTITAQTIVNVVGDPAWQIVGIGDFDGDGRADILWRNSTTGQDYVYLMIGATIGGNGFINTIADQNWKVAGVGDFNADGKADILWHHIVNGQTYIYYMNGLSIVQQDFVNTVPDPNWQIVAVGDLNDDGVSDIIWRNSSNGQNYVYMMNGSAIGANGVINTVADQNWHVYQ